MSCETKIGVDPYSGGAHRMTSDEYFAMARSRRDVESALASLAEGGCIVMHDCLRPNAGAATLERAQDNWCGTVRRAFAKLRERLDLDCGCGDFDFGVRIVRVLPNTAPIMTCKKMDDMTWEEFITHRAQWMRPVDRNFIRMLAGEAWV